MYGRVIVIRKNKRVYRRFEDEETCHIFYDMACEKFGKGRVYIATCKPRPIPRNVSLTKSLCWCPYCKELRRFKKDAEYGVRRCEICGISSNDFYVLQNNIRLMLEKFATHTKRKRKSKEGITIEKRNKTRTSPSQTAEARRHRRRLRQQRKNNANK